MRLDRGDEIESAVIKRQVRNISFPYAHAADVDPTRIVSMRRGHTFFRVIDPVNLSVARQLGQFADRSPSPASDVENCVGVLDGDVTQPPIGQLRVLSMHIPQNERAEET